MVVHETINKLKAMNLQGFVDVLEQMRGTTEFDLLSFEDRIGLMTDREFARRQNNRIQRLIQLAKFQNTHACMEDISYSADRKLDRQLLLELATGNYIQKAQNVNIFGPVSYTHLDVYKRQDQDLPGDPGPWGRPGRDPFWPVGRGGRGRAPDEPGRGDVYKRQDLAPLVEVLRKRGVPVSKVEFSQQIGEQEIDLHGSNDRRQCRQVSRHCRFSFRHMSIQLLHIIFVWQKQTVLTFPTGK